MIRLAKPNIPERAIRDAVESINSGMLIQGARVEAFEQALARRLGVEHVVAVSSGTAALHMALVALGIGKGDEVVVPAFSFPATANVVELCGAKPVFVDIKESDFCIDESRVEKAITKRTKAIMPVNEFGLSADLAPLIALGKKKKIPIIEDAACSLGATYRGKASGAVGLMGCYSFHPRKITTTGEGGAIATRDKKLAEKLRVLRNHGITKVNGKIDFILPGFNYRLTEFQAALGLPQLDELDQAIRERTAQAALYDQLLANNARVTLPGRFTDRTPTWQTYHLIVRKTDRDALIGKLKEQGLETNLGAQAIPNLSFYRKKYGFSRKDFPVATLAYERGLSLPVGGHLTADDVKKAAQLLTASLVS